MPSAISNSTMSPSSLRPTRWASVPPIWPAPINAILFRAMSGKILACREVRPLAGLTLSQPPFKSLVCTGRGRPSRLHDTVRPSGGRRLRMAVRQCQVGVRAHLDETRGGAQEFLGLDALVGPIERGRLRLGRRHELHAIVVERVDERDEALGLV